MAQKKPKNTELRTKAEAKVGQIPEALSNLTLDEAKVILHELEVHQVELEMQNEELRETQHRLEEVRDQYTDLFDFAPIGYLILDKKGVIANINLTACHLIGYDRSRIIGKPLSNYMSSEESGKLFLNLQKAFNTNLLPPFELEIKHKDNTLFTALLQGSTTSELDSTKSICRISFQDITELKEAEALLLEHEALQKEKEKIQQYLELAPVAFLLVDTHFKVQMINKKGCDLVGYKSSEILGKDWFENFIINVDDHKKILTDAYIESQLKCRNAEARIMGWTNVPLRNKKGRVIGTLIAGEDITSRKKLEQRKQNYTKELEDIVEIRTKKLNEALQNEKIINEMKSAFVSMASHEFRTPLTSIMSSAILIKKYNELGQPENELRHIKRIKSSVNQLTDILEDFLSLDKLERGIVVPHKDSFDLILFIEELIEELEWMLKKEQKINFRYKGETKVCLDKRILRNIFLNLISNAIKYSDLDIQLLTSVENDTISISVIDKGIGIPEEDQKHMFTKFFRSSNVTNIQGTGLGLSIVKHYTELLGGTIVFSSKSGEGSVFELSLPQSL